VVIPQNLSVFIRIQDIEKKKSEEKVPFRRKPFKGIDKTSMSLSSSYTNPVIKKKRESINIKVDTPTPEEVRAYDLFSPEPEMVGVSTRSRFDDIELD
jgi:hypothetical protein